MTVKPYNPKKEAVYAEHKARRERAIADYPDASRLAEMHGLTLIQHDEKHGSHFVLVWPGDRRLELYPGKMGRDPHPHPAKRPPKIELGREWSLMDVVSAAILTLKGNQ